MSGFLGDFLGPVIERIQQVIAPFTKQAALQSNELVKEEAEVVKRRLVESGAAQAVVLSGGCFQNAALLRQVQGALSDLPVLIHRSTPANDGGLALGQAVIAAAGQICAAESL